MLHYVDVYRYVCFMFALCLYCSYAVVAVFAVFLRLCFVFVTPHCCGRPMCRPRV